MHRALPARWLTRVLKIREGPSLATLPTYLCPVISHSVTSKTRLLPQRRRLHTESFADADVTITAATQPKQTPNRVALPSRKLPLNCTGCGAFSQTSDPKQFGYYDVEAKRVRDWVHPEQPAPKERKSREDEIVNDVLKGLDGSQLEALGIDPSGLLTGELPDQDDRELERHDLDQTNPPICDRCHNLAHHGKSGGTAGITMFHPTAETLRETIEESPYKYNHIYHVIDAADFPMSLIPRLNVLLGDIQLRTRNRRSRAGKYMKDRKTEMSFIITRGDLLAPTKEKLDRMMPYLRDVMREALGRLGGRVRLGNLRCVSAKRGWWTHQVREDIWRRGGAGWMVGKVNVGKSQLFEAVYPKGRVKPIKPKAVGAVFTEEAPPALPVQDAVEKADEAVADEEELNITDLLPPPQPVKQYPTMPIVSDLPGTTASPIRIPFGNKKGELIDLPGLARSDLELFVKPEHRQSLIMKSRITPEQVSLGNSESLLLGGGLIRITPRPTHNLTFLMYNFTPLDQHVTNTQKAEGFQDQTRVSPGIQNITLPEMGDKMQHAGTFKLRYDVTKRRAGPLTRKDAIGMKVEDLPFRVLSVDILIEGVGYVEVVAQVRARDIVTAPRSTAIAKSAENNASVKKEADADPFAAMMSQRRDNSSPQKQTQFSNTPLRRPADEDEESEELEPDWPAIDVFSPEGRFVDSRRPIEGWMINKPLVRPEHKRSRPRKSMRGQKKKEKRERRAAMGL